MYFKFKRATVFGLGQNLSKHETTRYVRNLGEHSSFGPPGYAYYTNVVGLMYGKVRV